MKQVLDGINNKDHHAWKELFDFFYASLCRYALHILNDGGLAEDVVQETFIRLWHSRTHFNSEKALAVYLYHSVNHNALKCLRDRHVEEERLKEWSEFEEMSRENFSAVLREEVYRKVRVLLDRLPESRREVILLSMQGVKGEEIAERLGISIHTVKQQKYRAYNFIRTELGRDDLILFLLFLPNAE